MANIPAPAKGTKGKPPTKVQTLDNLSRPEAGELKPLNFKVPSDFHRAFKTYAAAHDLSMVQLLREGFELVKAKRGA